MFVSHNKFTLKVLSLVALVAISIFFHGCVATEFATIEGNRMSNGQVGYSGYSVQLPDDYLSIDDPALADIDFTFARAMIQETEGSFGSSMLVRDVHAFYSRDTEQTIIVHVAQVRGSIRYPFSTMGKETIGRWEAMAEAYMFPFAVGQWEKFKAKVKPLS